MGIGTGVAVLNSQVVPISQVVLKTGSTVLSMEDIVLSVQGFRVRLETLCHGFRVQAPLQGTFVLL